MPLPKTDEKDLHPLVMPTDEYILNLFTHGLRETPKNAAAQLESVSGSYSANRLRALEIRGYVHSPGPSDRSGMYQITDWGRVAAAHVDCYSRGYDTLFHWLVKRVVAQSVDDLDAPDPSPAPDGDIDVDWIQLKPVEVDALRALSDVGGITIPNEFRKEFDDDHDTMSPDNTGMAADLLFTLYFYGLADRPQEGMDAYTISDAGENALNGDTDDLKRGITLDQLLD